MVSKTFRVYGEEGHRQRVSFFQSRINDFSENGRTRIIEIRNSDVTGTNEYSEVIITMDTEEACRREILAQVDDGIFEDSRTGKIEEVG